MADDVWRGMLAINLDHQFAVAREVLRPMIEARRGSLVFISSVNALGSSPGAAHEPTATAARETGLKAN
jgi:NAD(P)-dependent dehydrogenase (short-subunit alcohol dehydrogenase family)